MAVEPVTLVVSALVAGAAEAAKDIVSTTIKDAYTRLKTLVLKRFEAGGVKDDALVAHTPEQRDTLTGKLEQVGVDEPTVKAAEELLELLEATNKAKFEVNVSEAKGLMVGDHNVQHNTFN